MSRRRFIVVIPAAQQARFNDDAENEFNANTDTSDTDTDNNTFTVSLNPSGLDTAPITHYWCSWGGLTDEQFNALEAVFPPPARFFESDNDLEFRMGHPPGWKGAEEILNSLNLKRREQRASARENATQKRKK